MISPFKRIAGSGVFCALFAAVLVSHLAAHAAANVKDAIAPACKEGTFMVVSVDPRQFNADEMGNFIKGVLPAEIIDGETNKASLDKSLEETKDFTTKWSQAGGQRFYLALGMLNVMGGAPPMLIAPLKPGFVDADVKQLAARFLKETDAPKDQMTFEIVGGTLLVGPAASIQQYKNNAGKIPEALDKGLDSLKGASAIEIALAPGPQIKPMMFANPDGIPQEVGGRDTAKFGNAMEFGTLALGAPPNHSLNLSFKFPDAATATDAADHFNKVLTGVADGFPDDDATKRMRELFNDFKLRADGDTVTAERDPAQLQQMVATTIVPPIMAARRAAHRAVSMNSVRQIAVSVHAYAADHKGRLPNKLSELTPYLNLKKPDLLISARSGRQAPADWNHWNADEKARWIDRQSDYVLIPNLGAIDGLVEPSAALLVFEKQMKSDREGLIVGFADGHCRYVSGDELATIKQQIQQLTGKSLNQWSARP